MGSQNKGSMMKIILAAVAAVVVIVTIIVVVYCVRNKGSGDINTKFENAEKNLKALEDQANLFTRTYTRVESSLYKTAEKTDTLPHGTPVVFVDAQKPIAEPIVTAFNAINEAEIKKSVTDLRASFDKSKLAAAPILKSATEDKTKAAPSKEEVTKLTEQAEKDLKTLADGITAAKTTVDKTIKDLEANVKALQGVDVAVPDLAPAPVA
jgi:hypothetical protein